MLHRIRHDQLDHETSDSATIFACNSSIHSITVKAKSGELI